MCSFLGLTACCVFVRAFRTFGLRRMPLGLLAIVLAGLTIIFISGGETAPCLTGTTVVIDVATASDMNTFIDAINCTGPGVFNVTWYKSLYIGRRIEVSNQKNVTISGSGFHTIFGTLYDGNDAIDSTTVYTETAVDAGSATGVFSVSNGSTLRLNNLGIARGTSENGGAVAVVSGSQLHVFDCIFSRNNASTGGAILVSRSEIYVGGTTTFSNNSADFGGEKIKTHGAVYVSRSTVHIDGSTSFVKNTAESGGALFATESEIHIDGDTDFDRNSAEGAMPASSDSSFNPFEIPDTYQGGAMFAHLSELYISGSTDFSNNSADEDGGGLCAISSSVFMDGSTRFAKNLGTGDGGGMYAELSEVYVDGSTEFSFNSADFGGGMFTEFSEVYIDGSTSCGNNLAQINGDLRFCTDSCLDKKPAWNGGVIFYQSEVYINGSADFYNNSAGFAGGGFYAGWTNASIGGSSTFTNNRADSQGAALHALLSDIHITGDALFAGNTVSENGGGFYSEVGAERASIWSILFIDNSADGLGGAMFLEDSSQLEVSGATFQSNKATLGGAVYLATTKDKQTEFSACTFEGNEAADGGAIYLFTRSGIDIVTASVFRANVAQFSGGAVFHTGPLRVTDSSFVANRAGVEGPAVISIGVLQSLSNASFSENLFDCRVGKYGYNVKDQIEVCTSCFDEVCARCSGGNRDGTQFEQVRTDGMPVCAEPPPGATAGSSGTTVTTLTLKEGYYRTSNQSHAVLKCYHEEACVGGNDPTEYCALGYQGPYCAVCVEGFAPGIGYSCRECSGGVTRSAVGLTVAVGLAALLVAALLFSHLGSAVDDRAGEDAEEASSVWGRNGWSCGQSCLVKMIPLTAIKIVVTVWQIISQFDGIAGGVYPELYNNFVEKLSPANLDLDFALSYSCIVTTDFYDHLLVATITPPLALVLLAGSYLAAKKRNSRSAAAMCAVWRKHQSAVLYVAFFVYAPVSYKIFQTFACDELDDGNSFLRVDYSLSCSTARHSRYEAYAVTMVGVYPVGIAAAFVWLLVRHRRDLVKPDRERLVHLEPFSGMWAAYKPSRYYYEVIECSRRIALTSVAAFVLPNSTAQISIALLLAVVLVFISEAVSPFEKAVDMMLYRWGNGIVVASMYVAFLAKVDVGSGTAHALLTFSGVLILANVFMVVAVLLQTLLLVKEWRKKKTETVRMVDAPVRRAPSTRV